jgi:anti-sigma regulatory factor (Ser/Thr protein kinase)
VDLTVSKRAIFPLHAHSTSPAIARAHTARLLDPVVASEQRGVAQLVVSELVTNAVMHGTEPIALQLELEWERLRIEVFDSEPALRAVRPHSESRPELSIGGRGLQIVEALAESCGVESRPDGKAVWAVLRIRPGTDTRP